MIPELYERIDKCDLDKIKEELSTLPHFEHQIYLQGCDSNMDPFEPTIGSNYLLVDASENDYDIPLFDLPVINNFIKKYDLVRTRVLILRPKECYTWHKDKSTRLHIPVTTNESCFLLVDNTSIHLPADGTIYEVDTTLYHTALNASRENRIHIVGARRV